MSDKILLVIFQGIFASENYQFCGFTCEQMGNFDDSGYIPFNLYNPLMGYSNGQCPMIYVNLVDGRVVSIA